MKIKCKISRAINNNVYSCLKSKNWMCVEAWFCQIQSQLCYVSCVGIVCHTRSLSIDETFGQSTTNIVTAQFAICHQFTFLCAHYICLLTYNWIAVSFSLLAKKTWTKNGIFSAIGFASPSGRELSLGVW